MDVLRLSSPIIAAAIVGLTLSAPALFAGSSDATRAGSTHCIESAATTPCLDAQITARRDGRPQ